MTQYKSTERRRSAGRSSLVLVLVIIGSLGVAWGIQGVRPTSSTKKTVTARKAGPPQVRTP